MMIVSKTIQNMKNITSSLRTFLFNSHNTSISDFLLIQYLFYLILNIKTNLALSKLTLSIPPPSKTGMALATNQHSIV